MERLTEIEEQFTDKIKSLVKDVYLQGIDDCKNDSVAFEDGFDADVYRQAQDIFDEIVLPELEAANKRLDIALKALRSAVAEYGTNTEKIDKLIKFYLKMEGWVWND